MRHFKISATILILIAGLIGSYFIIRNSVPTVEIREESKEEKKPLIQNPIQWVADILGNLDKTGELSRVGAPEQPSNNNEESNFTAAFSQLVFEQIKSSNAAGLTEKDGQPAIFAPNEDILSEEWLNQFLSAKSPVNPSGPYHPKIDENRFKISQDISSENQMKYIKNLESLTQKHLDGFNKTNIEVLNEITERKDVSSAVELARLYGAIAEESYQIEIPENWIDFHKAFLSHFYSAQSMWAAIANFQDDPLRAYLATQYISNLEDSATGLRVLLAQGMQRNNLKF